MKVELLLLTLQKLKDYKNRMDNCVPMISTTCIKWTNSRNAQIARTGSKKKKKKISEQTCNM